MAVKTNRKVVRINEDKCNGCGLCVPSCAEGALKIIGGKARLVSDKYCDGLGACLGECPQGAITIEERPAEEFDEVEAKLHVEQKRPNIEEKQVCGCESAAIREMKPIEPGREQPITPSQLSHWPVQLILVPAYAPFLKGTEVVLAADCTAFAYAGFHQGILNNHVLTIACPKLDDFESHLKKLTQIVANSGLKSLTVVHMEVPCCSGLVFMAKKAIEATNSKIPLKEVTIKINGELK